jgi:hypothetical protein
MTIIRTAAVMIGFLAPAMIAIPQDSQPGIRIIVVETEEEAAGWTRRSHRLLPRSAG